MSTIVKGMTMPDHCWECWLMRNMTCGACGEMIPVTGKRNHCPLVALPDKHGRLVDVTTAYQDTMLYSNRYRESVLKIIDALPTVVEEEDGE